MKGESAAVPPSKRQRTKKQSAQRRRGRLTDFTNLSTDVFSLIASYLLPIDILSLARSNKLFHNLLMTRSSRAIWLNAMKNVEGLPPCPSNMSEPEYVALLFTNVCSSCGTLSRSPVDEFLLVRLCAPCKRDELIKLNQIPEELHELVHYSARTSIDGISEIQRSVGIVIRGEVNVIWNEYKELARDADKKTFEAWVAQRKEQTARRRKWAGELARFFESIETKRAEEKEELLKTREAQIKEKLFALGWEGDDMKFHPYGEGALQWYELVEMPKQPRPLTDRVWKNLYAKLKPLLEAKRERHLQRERSKRHYDRISYLDTFLYQIKHREPPLLKVKRHQSNSTAYSRMFRPVMQRDVFPFFQDALELPFIQAMTEEDLGVEAFKQGLEKHQSEIETFIADWRDQTRTYLVNLIREEDLEYTELLQRPKNMDPDAFARLSDDQKLLLRADSLFYVGSPKPPYNYEMVLRVTYPVCPDNPAELWKHEHNSDYTLGLPDLDIIHRHTAAQEVARDLLMDLGKSNASWVEVDQLKYSCERCHDSKPRDWTSIIEHYLKQKRIWAKAHAVLAQQGITYNNVHDPTSYSNIVLIKPSKPSKFGAEVPVRQCNLCVNRPISQDVTLSAPKLDKHLLEIHGVTRPELQVHYNVLIPEILNGPPAGYRYVSEEPEDDDEEVEADNEPEVESKEAD